MARKISISFKETKKDIELYDILMQMDDRSSDIKEVLREKYCSSKKETTVKKDDNLLEF